MKNFVASVVATLSEVAKMMSPRCLVPGCRGRLIHRGLDARICSQCGHTEMLESTSSIFGHEDDSRWQAVERPHPVLYGKNSAEIESWTCDHCHATTPETWSKCSACGNARA